MKPIFLNDILVYPFESFNDLLNYIEDKKKILIAINAHKILDDNKKMKTIINSNIGYSDGIGSIMILKKKGFRNVKKISGSELWLKIIDKFCDTKTFYFVGSNAEVIEDVILKIKKIYKNIKIINYRDGYIKNEFEEELLINDIVNQKPDIVFVAMGSPKQEILMEKMYELHPAIYQGLGGSFDVFVGKVKKVPIWIENLGLEWLFRWIMEPVKRTKKNLLLFKFFLVYKLGRFS